MSNTTSSRALQITLMRCRKIFQGTTAIALFLKGLGQAQDRTEVEVEDASESSVDAVSEEQDDPDEPNEADIDFDDLQTTSDFEDSQTDYDALLEDVNLNIEATLQRLEKACASCNWPFLHQFLKGLCFEYLSS